MHPHARCTAPPLPPLRQPSRSQPDAVPKSLRPPPHTQIFLSPRALKTATQYSKYGMDDSCAPRQYACCRSAEMIEVNGMKFCQSCGELADDPRPKSSSGRNCTSKSFPGKISEEETSSTRSLYNYHPLKEGQFRLIEIRPGDFDDPLRCQIYHGWIHQEQYEAVSYTWADESGDQSLSQEIVVSCTRKLEIRTVKATKNCEMALRRIRRASQLRVV
jgi:hypothetical protein